MFLHAEGEENTFLGPLRHRVIEPDEFGVNGVALNAGAAIVTKQVSIAGFAHHQVCFQVNANTNAIRTDLAFGQFVGSGAFISNSQTQFLSIRTVNVTNSSRYFPVYFGIGRDTHTGSTIGELRFATTVYIRLANTSGSNRIITAWLESMG